MLFDIINPSDPYTIEAPDLEIAANAIALLGQGKYGLNELTGDQSGHVPMFLFGEHDAWFIKQFGRDFKASLTHVMETRADEFAKALASVFIGTAADKRQFEADARDCADHEAFQAMLLERHDAKRTSTNDIGRCAWSYADHIAKQQMDKQQVAAAG